MNDTLRLKKTASRLFLGFVFLANPLFSYLDFLPDFIGCLILFSAYRPLLFLDARVQAARRTTRLVALLSVARLLLTPVFFWSHAGDDGNTTMLLSFVFAVLGILLELSLVKNLNETLTYLSVRCDSGEALPFLDPAFSLLSIFAVVKNVAAALPDLLTLFSPNSTLEYNPGSLAAAASFTFAKWVSYFAFFAVVFVFGIVVLVRLKRYTAAFSREEEFLLRVQSAALEGEEGGCKLKVRFDISGALSTLTCLALFSFDYYLDYVSVLPSFVALALCAFILRRVREWRKVRAWEYGFCAVGFLVGLAAFVYRAFYSQDTFVGVTFHTRPFTVVFGVAQALLVIVAFWIASGAVRQVALKETEIDLGPAVKSARFFSLFSAALCAYNYILPKGAGVTDLTEAVAFFALVAGAVFVFFTFRIDTAFAKESEWKFF
ncbi:MAG: hypothetical protein IKT43_02700 [Clostridia bacterium]|nr:hypothetical protein [Clostridia bacterium]